MNIIMGILVILVVGAIIYVENGDRGYNRGKNLFEWFNKKYHWNDISHFLFEFFLTVVIAKTFGLLWLAGLISIAWVLVLELGIQKHYKDFWKSHDFVFDVMTHLGGTLSAFFFLI